MVCMVCWSACTCTCKHRSEVPADRQIDGQCSSCELCGSGWDSIQPVLQAWSQLSQFRSDAWHALLCKLAVELQALHMTAASTLASGYLIHAVGTAA